MAKSAGFPQQMTDLFGRYRLAIQGVGVLLAAAAFGAVWKMAPTNLAAQLSATLFGVSLALFAQFFFMLRRLKPEERGTLGFAGLGCFGLCLAASLGATGYHWSKGPHVGAMSGSTASGGASAGAAGTEVSFAGDEPNRLVIRASGTNWRKVAVEVQKIWELTPDKPGPDIVDWPPDVPVELQAEKKPPYRVMAISGTTMPIEIVLQPVLAEAAPEPLQLEGNRLRMKFTKPPKDHVYLLRLELIDTRGKSLNLGSVLYMPELKTGYNSPSSDANKEIFRELAALPMPKSAKLANLAPPAPSPGAKK